MRPKIISFKTFAQDSKSEQKIINLFLFCPVLQIWPNTTLSSSLLRMANMIKVVVLLRVANLAKYHFILNFAQDGKYGQNSSYPHFSSL